MMTIGSLFSGIGGLELGLERAGLGPVLFQVEQNKFCLSVLAKHWPTVPRFTDVRAVGSDLPRVDVLCGGFPCQDVSSAGEPCSFAGERSGLWYEYRRIVETLAPSVVVVENVASGARRWLPHVRRDLHVLGYRTRAFQLSAADVGAPHLRRRVFVVAHHDVQPGDVRPQAGEAVPDAARDGFGRDAARVGAAPDPERVELRDEPGRRRGTGREGPGESRDDGADRVSPALGNALHVGREGTEGQGHEGRTQPAAGGWWASEPAVGRVVDGLRGGLDGRVRRERLRALGNAVVPQCAEAIGRVIRAMATHRENATQRRGEAP